MYSNGYKYRKLITIDATKVFSSSQTDFPVHFKNTDTDLKSIVNGGLVTNGTHLDIRFETTGGTQLAHEIQEYNPTTGFLSAWIKLDINNSTNTTYYLYFGKDSVSSDEQNISSVWSNGYTQVLHLGNKTLTGAENEIPDSSGNNRTASGHGFQMEVGQITLSNTIDAGTPVYQDITFQNTYVEPVVVTFVQTRNGSDTIDSRVTNLTSTGCRIFVQEPTHGEHSSETVSYIVVEKGEWYLSEYVTGNSAIHIEAGKVNTKKYTYEGIGLTDYETVSFGSSFAGTPAVVHKLMTRNTTTFASTAMSNLSSSGFRIAIETLDAGTTFSIDETIGWIAIEHGLSNISTDYISGSKTTDNERLVIETHGNRNDGTSDGDDDTEDKINFASTFSSVPIVIASGNTYNGLDGYVTRGSGTNSTTSNGLFASEGQTTDSERNHANESFSRLIFEKDLRISGIPTVTSGGITGSALNFNSRKGQIINSKYVMNAAHTTHFAIMAWVKFTYSNDAVATAVFNLDRDKYIELAVNGFGSNQKIRATMYGATSGVKAAVGATSINDGNWHLIAVTYARLTGTSTFTVWLDNGTSDGSNTFGSFENLGLTGATASSMIGIRSKSTAYNVKGGRYTENRSFFHGDINNIFVISGIARGQHFYADHYRNVTNTTNWYTIGGSQGYPSANRAAKISGKAVEASSVSTKLTGKDSSSSNRASVISGSANVASAKSAKVTGSDVFDVGINAALKGKDSTNNTRASVISGKSLGSSTISAGIFGSFTLSSDLLSISEFITNTKAAKISGYDTSALDIQTKIRGGLNEGNSITAKVSGIEATTGEVLAKIKGIDTSSVDIQAKTAGKLSADSSILASVYGATRGESETLAKIKGKESTDSNISAKLGGSVSQDGEIFAVIRGSTYEDSSISSKIIGVDNVDSDILSKVKGSLATESSISSKITGGVGSSRAVKVLCDIWSRTPEEGSQWEQGEEILSNWDRSNEIDSDFVREGEQEGDDWIRINETESEWN